MQNLQTFLQALTIPKLAAAVGLFAVALVALWTGIYTVPAESEAVVLRFGRFSHIVLPGLHFKLPMGIDTTNIVQSSVS